MRVRKAVLKPHQHYSGNAHRFFRVLRPRSVGAARDARLPIWPQASLSSRVAAAFFRSECNCTSGDAFQ